MARLHSRMFEHLVGCNYAQARLAEWWMDPIGSFHRLAHLNSPDSFTLIRSGIQVSLVFSPSTRNDQEWIMIHSWIWQESLYRELVWSLSGPECGFVEAPAFSLEHDLGLVCRLASLFVNALQGVEGAWWSFSCSRLHCWLGVVLEGTRALTTFKVLGFHRSKVFQQVQVGWRHFLPELQTCVEWTQHHNPLDTYIAAKGRLSLRILGY